MQISSIVRKKVVRKT